MKLDKVSEIFIKFKSEDEYAELAKQIINGEVFNIRQIKDISDAYNVFKPLRFVVCKFGTDCLDQFGIVYQRKDKAIKGKNYKGYPVFDSMCVLSVEDTDKISRLISQNEEKGSS